MADANASRALLKTRYSHSDIYVGTPQQLCTAGLVRADQFPGQPGKPKVRATYFLVDGLPTPHGCSCFELTYVVQRISTARYSVSVDVCEEEIKRRKPFHDKNGILPLELPGTVATNEQQPPSWAPAGWTFRRARAEDYVFVATAEQLMTSGLMEGQPLPVCEDEKRKTVRFRSARFGWVIVSQRAAAAFFVALDAPNEIRYANYHVSDYGGATVYHQGTKEQLQMRGLGAGLGFPGEPGCNSRKVTTVDPKTGCEVRIELMHPSQWCGEVPRFDVMARRSDEEQEAVKAAKRQAEAEKARMERLKTMPDTPHAYRDKVAQTFWTWVGITEAQMKSEDGYRFTSEVIDEFIESVTEAYWTIKNGATAGASPRQKFQQVMCANAKADKPLQQFLSAIEAGDSH